MNLVVLEPLGVEETAFKQLAKEYLGDDFNISFHKTRVEDVSTLILRAKEADVVMLSNLPFTKEVLAHCPKLKMICVAFTGVDHVDLDYCKEKGILVSNASGYATTAVAELVIGLTIGLYRNLVGCNTATRASGTKEGLIGFELAGKKFGIVGAGAIGLATAKLAAAFGCDVYLYNGGRTVAEVGMKTVTLETLLENCDIVSIHTPLTPATHHLIGAKELALMKPTSILINTARGPVVATDALATALKEGRLAGAGLDVFDTEPPVSASNPLLTAPSTLLTPHVAFATAESMMKRAHIAFENVRQWANGTPQNVIL